MYSILLLTIHLCYNYPVSKMEKKKLKKITNKKIKKLNRLFKSHKLTYLRIARIGLVLTFTFNTLYIVGIHSSYLINNTLKYINLGLAIISFLVFLVFLSLYFFKERDIILKAKRWWLNIISGLFCIGCCLFLSLLYGPNPAFRDWLVTTAMATMNHQYLCKMFYGDDEIADVLNANYILEPDEEMNTNLVDVVADKKKKKTFQYDEDNEYEVQMFKDHEEDEIYRLLRFTVNDQNAYLAVVYDPANVSVVVSKYALNSGEYVVNMAKRTNALIAVNGGRFIDPEWKSAGGNPDGVTITKGKVITDYPYGGGLGVIGFNQDNVLVLYKDKSAQELLDLGVRDCVTSLPFLIVNGNKAFTKGNGGYGYGARTAIGQRDDGVTLILVVDSNETRTNGASMKDLTDIFANYGAINAAALDGGTSTSMVENGKMISRPVNASLKHVTRPVATGIIVTAPPKEENEIELN